TIAGTFVRRRFALPSGEERLFRVDGETQLKGICHWQRGNEEKTEKEGQGLPIRHDQPKGWPLEKRGVRRDLPVLVVVHGLEGSCESKYMLGIAEKAWARGFHAVRLNQRNCGGTERLTPTLYNSGMSADYRAVLLELIAVGFEQIYFAGYS